MLKLMNNSFFHVLLGTIFLSLISQVAFQSIFSPVPVTLQTFGISLLVIVLGQYKAPLAVLGYLVLATLGVPVLAGGVSNSLWYTSPKAGYLLGFVLSSILLSMLLTKKRPFWKQWIVFSVNEGSILVLGCLWLSSYVGFKSAFFIGFLPLLSGALLKITLATFSYYCLREIKFMPCKEAA